MSAIPKGLLAELRPVLGLAWPHRALLVLGIVVMMAESAAALAVPWIGGELAGAVLRPEASGAIRGLLLGLICVFALQALLAYASSSVLEGVAERIVAGLRVRLYDHLQALPLEYFQRRRLGDSLALFTNDVYSVSAFVSGTLVCIPPLLLTAAGAMLLMFTIRFDLALLTVLVVPLFFLALKIAGRRLRPISRRLQEEEAAGVAIAQENLGLLAAIKSFTREPQESDRFRGQVGRILELSAHQRRIRTSLVPIVQFVAGLGLVLVLALALSDRFGVRLSPVEIVAFLLYAHLLTRPIASLADIYGHTQVARVSLQRLEGALGERPEPAHSGATIEIRKGAIEFKGVSFAYPDRPPALCGLDLGIFGGEIVAIVGPNGAGKSTLAHLLLRLHEPASGSIHLDGQDIATASLSSLRSRIGLVPQHVMLFNASVRDNIAYGLTGAADEAIEAAARASRAHEFITLLPSGYDTVIGDRGVRLSGGQQQRIALARALLKDPPILVLDEATAMFDPAAEEDFLVGCAKALRGRTVILITHRPASLRTADRIVHLRNGRVERIEARAQRPLRAVADG